MFGIILFAASLLCACGGSGNNTTPPPVQQVVATPTIATATAQNSAVVMTLADSTSGATIYYTLDGSTPNTTSQIYHAPFLVASNLSVNVLATASGYTNSSVATKAFTPGIASGTLVWSDEFANSGSANVQPDPAIWTYDTGLNCCGNNELETYCAQTSSASPCSSTNPNAFIGTDGYLHIVAMKPSSGIYTSGRLKSQGLVSFMYGRIEARMKLPESQGMWPAFWMLGNNITTLSWPACGELDIMEHINGSNPAPYVGGTPPGFDWIAGSVHGGTTAAHADGTQQFHPSGFSAAAWHTYGMNWTKGQVQFYVDDPANIYATFTAGTNTFSGPWPFDQGPQFVILNLAVGGDWPGPPDTATPFPSEMTVDYVRVYTN